MNKTIEQLTQENENLKQQVESLKENLKKYTNPQCYKNYYEKNKDILLERKRQRYHEKKKKEVV